MTRRPNISEPGIYRDVSFEEYAAINAVNSTTLRWLRFGARECWYRRRFGTVVTDSMHAGSLAHIQILDPQQYLKRVVEWTEPVYEERPALQWDKMSSAHYVTACGCYRVERTDAKDWRAAYMGDLTSIIIGTHGTVTAAKAACKKHHERTTPRQPKLDADGSPKLAPQNPKSAVCQAFVAANPGRTIVTRRDLEQAKAISMAVRDNSSAMTALSGIWGTEVVIVWLDPDTGVKCKARLDWLTTPQDPGYALIGDLKLCKDHSPPWFPRWAAGAEYHAQMAWYRAGLREAIRQLYGTSPEIHCVLLAVKSSGSHDSTVYDLDEGSDLAAGDKLNAERLQQLLYNEDTYGERPWPGRCPRAPLDLATHASWALGEQGMPTMGGKAMFGNEEEEEF